MRGQRRERLGEVEVVGELGARRSPCPRGRSRRAGRGSTSARAGRRSGRRPRRTARRGWPARPPAPPRRRGRSRSRSPRPSRSGRASGRPAGRRPAARGRSRGRSSPWCAAWACTAGRCPPGGPSSRPRGSAPPARRRACPASGSSRARRPGAPPARAGSAAAPPGCAAGRRRGCRWPPCGSGRRTGRSRRRRAGRRRRRPGRDGRRARRRCAAGSRGPVRARCSPPGTAVAGPAYLSLPHRGGRCARGHARGGESCTCQRESALRAVGGARPGVSESRRRQARVRGETTASPPRGASRPAPARRPAPPRPARRGSAPRSGCARSRTDRCPLKCGVVKNGDDSSWTSACLSSSAADPEHDHVGVALAGLRVDRVRAGVAEEDERLAAHLVDRLVRGSGVNRDVRHREGELVHVLDPRLPRSGHGVSVGARPPRRTGLSASGQRWKRATHSMWWVIGNASNARRAARS